MWREVDGGKELVVGGVVCEVHGHHVRLDGCGGRGGSLHAILSERGGGWRRRERGVRMVLALWV